MIVYKEAIKNQELSLFFEEKPTEIELKNEEIKKKICVQCAKILNLLRKNEFVPTKNLIDLGIYNHTARISDLRKGRFDGNQYLIRSEKRDVWGFMLLGHTNRS